MYVYPLDLCKEVIQLYVWVYNKEYNYGTAYDTETLQTGSHESVAATQWQPAALWSPVVMYKEFVVATVNLIGWCK